ncbi:MAG: CBS domain-containing protein [Oscillospiraceae bacterium]|nr:CBS domain-containing protein [Oscillospiraceae bacterium]
MNTAMLLKPKSMVSYIYGDLSAEEGLREFISNGYTAVPVIDRDGMYMGVVSERDFLYRILDAGSVAAVNEGNLTVAELVNDTRFESVTIDADIQTLFSRIQDQNFVPVVDSRGMFSGIVTRKDVLMRMEYKLSHGEYTSAAK